MTKLEDRVMEVSVDREGGVMRDSFESRKKMVEPGGLAGWVLAMIRGTRAKGVARHLEVVETLALGGRRQLTLVTCDGERFLVGSGADSVETIVRVHDPSAKIAEESWV